jgi:hypothetical protein
MISSSVLAAAESNTRHCIYNGQNSSETWGGLPVVLLFGDDYQLMPIKKDGAINGYDKKCCRSEHHLTEKMTDKQLTVFHGDELFTNVMTQQVYFLTKNYRVKCETFKALLDRVRVARATKEDADKIINLHQTFYDEEFRNRIENHDKTVWLFAKNDDVRKKNVDKLVETSKKNKLPVARLDCWWETNKQQSGTNRQVYRSHFDATQFNTHTELCVGARVALRKWNILPCAGLYSGAIGTIVDIVYSKDNHVGPNDKQHKHLPEYVVVDFPHLKLPPYIRPWDKLHPTVNISFVICTPIA